MTDTEDVRDIKATCRGFTVEFHDVLETARENLDDCPHCGIRNPLGEPSEGYCRGCSEFLLSEDDVKETWERMYPDQPDAAIASMPH